MDLSDKHSRDWLCQQHSFDKIKHWVNSLSFVYFFRAFGGHANDSDTFETRFTYTNKNDLEKILMKLDIEGLNDKKISGRAMIKNHEWFIYIDDQRKRITLFRSTDYNVTDSDFGAALDLDKTIKELKLDEKVDRDIIYRPCCVSRERYSELA